MYLYKNNGIPPTLKWIKKAYEFCRETPGYYTIKEKMTNNKMHCKDINTQTFFLCGKSKIIKLTYEQLTRNKRRKTFISLLQFLPNK